MRGNPGIKAYGFGMFMLRETPAPPVLPASGFSMSGGTPTFTVPTVAGQQYRLVYKDGLAGGSWTPVGDWTPGTGAPVVLTDSTAASHSQRFYKLETK
jgi:hypothetical protein